MRYLGVMGVAAQGKIESVREDATGIALVALVAEDGPARLRMARALAGRPELVLRSGASIKGLVIRGAPDDLLIHYCETVSSNELDLFKELKRDLPELLVVAVCECADSRAVRRLVDGGIDGLVFADQLETALVPTIAAVLVGQTAVPRDLRACLRKRSLSTRERQILGMAAIGCTNAEIGSRMFLAESTVKSHLSSAYTKLGARSRSEAVALIMDPQGSLGTGILALIPHAQSRTA